MDNSNHQELTKLYSILFGVLAAAFSGAIFGILVICHRAKQFEKDHKNRMLGHIERVENTEKTQ